MANMVVLLFTQQFLSFLYGHLQHDTEYLHSEAAARGAKGVQVVKEPRCGSKFHALEHSPWLPLSIFTQCYAISTAFIPQGT